MSDEKALRAAVPILCRELRFPLVSLRYDLSLSPALLTALNRRLQRQVSAQPDDGHSWLTLAKNSFTLGRLDDTRRFADLAVRALSRIYARDTSDTAAAAVLSEALTIAGRHGEAEYLLRPLANAPANRDWRPAAALAYLLRFRGATVLARSLRVATVTVQSEDGDKSGPAVAQYPTPAAREAAGAYFREGEAWCDRAVALAPDEAAVYGRRAEFKAYTRGGLILATPPTPGSDNETTTSDAVRRTLTAASLIADLRREAELAPDSWFAVCRAALYSAYAGIGDWSGERPRGAAFWGSLAPRQQSLLRQDGVSLDRLLNRDATAVWPEVRAELCSTRGLLLFLADDLKAAAPCFEEAVRAAPERDDDWERLAYCRDRSSDLANLAAVLRRRVNAAPTVARNHLLLVWAEQKAGHATAARDAFFAAQRRFPSDREVRLAEIALLLLRSDSPHSPLLAGAGRLLSGAASAFPTGGIEWENFQLLRAIQAGLSGNVRQGRAFVQSVLAVHSTRASALRVARALGAAEAQPDKGENVFRENKKKVSQKIEKPPKG